MKYQPLVMAMLFALGGACSKDSEGANGANGQVANAANASPSAKLVPRPKASKSVQQSAPRAAPAQGVVLDAAAAKTLFTTGVKTLADKASSLGDHKGKALLVVNVASKCGLTPQYTDLEKLHKEYSKRGFAVVGFPCNQFGGQEPGTSEEIAHFCSTKYGVTFPMFEKVEVNGKNRHPIYSELTKIADAKGKAGDIQWNFEKFVISADGKTVTRFRPRTKPYDPTLIATIEAGLPKK